MKANRGFRGLKLKTSSAGCNLISLEVAVRSTSKKIDVAEVTNPSRGSSIFTAIKCQSQSISVPLGATS